MNILCPRSEYKSIQYLEVILVFLNPLIFSSVATGYLRCLPVGIPKNDQDHPERPRTTHCSKGVKFIIRTGQVRLDYVKLRAIQIQAFINLRLALSYGARILQLLLIMVDGANENCHFNSDMAIQTI